MKMLKSAKWLKTLALTLVTAMVITLVPEGTVSVKAEGIQPVTTEETIPIQADGKTENWKEVHVTSWEELKEALASEESSVIFLDAAIGEKKIKYGDGVVLKVYGSHMLELNGHNIDANLGGGSSDFGDNYGTTWGDKEVAVFKLMENSSLTVSDNSGDNSGMIRAHAYMVDPQNFGNVLTGGSGTPTSGSLDVFHLEEGASLTLNGGTYKAGRRKHQYVCNGENFLRDEDGRFDGYAYQVVGGNIINVQGNNCSIQINGGYFENKLESMFDQDQYYMNNTMVIADGEFYCETNGTIFDWEWGVKTTIYAGVFETDYLTPIWSEGERGGRTCAKVSDGYSCAIGLVPSMFLQDADGNFLSNVVYSLNGAKGMQYTNADSFPYMIDHQVGYWSTDRNNRKVTVTPPEEYAVDLVASNQSKVVPFGEGDDYEDNIYVYGLHSQVSLDQSTTKYFPVESVYKGVYQDEEETDETLALVNTMLFTVPTYELIEMNEHTGETSTVVFDNNQEFLTDGIALDLDKVVEAGRKNTDPLVWTSGVKAGQPVVFDTSVFYTYFVRGYYDGVWCLGTPSKSSEVAFYTWRASSKNTYRFIAKSGMETDLGAISISHRSDEVLVDDVVYLDGTSAEDCSNNVEIKSAASNIASVRELGWYENGVYKEGNITFKNNSVYAVLLELTASAEYSFDPNYQLSVVSEKSQNYFMRNVVLDSVSEDGKTARVMIKFRTVCHHEWDPDEKGHACQYCMLEETHDFGPITVVDANTKERSCTVCGYTDTISAAKISYVSLNTGKYDLVAGNAVPDYTDFAVNGLDSSVYTSVSSAEWWYAGMESPSSVEEAGLSEETKVSVGSTLSQGYYVVKLTANLGEEYRFASKEKDSFGTLMRTNDNCSWSLSANGTKHAEITNDSKTATGYFYVYAYAPVQANVILPEVKVGITLPEYCATLMKGANYQGVDDLRMMYVVSVSSAEDTSVCYASALYLPDLDQWQYYDGYWLQGKSATEDFVFSMGEDGLGKAYSVRIVLMPMQGEYSAADTNTYVTVNTINSNAVNVSAVNSAWAYVDATYAVDKIIRTVNISCPLPEYGKAIVNGDASTLSGVPENTSAMALVWTKYDEKAGEYVALAEGETPVCGQKYRRTLVLTADSDYEFLLPNDGNLFVSINGVEAPVSVEYSNDALCWLQNSRTLSLFVTADFSHQMAYQETTKQATCREEGEELYVCTRCGEETRIATAKLSHQMIEVKEMMADCVTTGYTRDCWYCSRCGCYYADKEGTDGLNQFSVEMSYVGWNHHTGASEWEYEITDTTHKKVCPDCHTATNASGVGAEEKHKWVAITDADGNPIGAFNCDTCGAIYGMSLEGENISIFDDGQIGMNYYLFVPDVMKGAVSYSIKIAGNEMSELYDVRAQKQISASNNSGIFGQGKTYQITVNVAADQMKDDIALYIYYNSGSGNELNRTYVETVAGYAYKLLADASYAGKYDELLSAMLQYGSGAQRYFDYHYAYLLNNLADYELNKYVSSTIIDKGQIPSQAYGSYSLNTEAKFGGLSYYGSSLVLASNTQMKHYFTPEAGASVSDYTVSAAALNGTTNTAISGVKLVEKDGLWYVNMPTSFKKTMTDTYRLVITQKSTGAKLTLEYAPINYVKVVMEDKSAKEELKNVLTKLYWYLEAIKNYF